MILVGVIGGAVIGGLIVVITSAAPLLRNIGEAQRYDISGGLTYQITNWIIVIVLGVVFGSAGGAVVAVVQLWVAGFGPSKGNPIGWFALSLNMILGAATCFAVMLYFSFELEFEDTLGNPFFAPILAAAVAAIFSWIGQTAPSRSVGSKW